MNIRELRTRLDEPKSEFTTRCSIPLRGIQNWGTGVRASPELLESRVHSDLINRKTTVLPKYDSQKCNLPGRRDYVGAVAWLKAVRDCIGETVVFALDTALMCQGMFGGRSDEFLVWVYGDDDLSRFNGVVVLDNRISSHNVKERNGLQYTDFSRTVSDALANEPILDMQGITEALSKYYYRNGESFDGLSVVPECQDRFDRLAREAIHYYRN